MYRAVVLADSTARDGSDRDERGYTSHRCVGEDAPMNITFQGFDSLSLLAKIPMRREMAVIAKIPLPMTVREFENLLHDRGEYSCSVPSDVVPGKMWLRHDGIYDPRCKVPRWLLGWYGPAHLDSKGVEVCTIEYITIEFVDDVGNPLPISDPNQRTRP